MEVEPESDMDPSQPIISREDDVTVEGVDGEPTISPGNGDGDIGDTGSRSPPTPEEGIQINDEESIASADTTLTRKADREVRELMQSVIDSSTSQDDQSSITQDGSEATEIHVPDLDISVDQSENGSVIMGQNIDQSEAGFVADRNDHPDSKPIFGEELSEFLNAKQSEERIAAPEMFQNLDHSGSSDQISQEGQSSSRGVVSPLFVSLNQDGTTSPSHSQGKSEGEVWPGVHTEDIAQDGNVFDIQKQNRSDDGTTDGMPSPDHPEQSPLLVHGIVSPVGAGFSGQDRSAPDLGRHSPVSLPDDPHLEEYDSMDSFSQQGHHKIKVEEIQVQEPPAQATEGHASDENVKPDVATDRVPVIDNKDDVERKEEDEESVEEDSSQFAQLIVQHVLGHAVSSFNESDASLHDDTTEAESLASLPQDGDRKLTATGDVEPLYGTDVVEVRDSRSDTPLGQADNDTLVEQYARSLTDIQIEDSAYLEDSFVGSGIPKRSNITLDSEMENETFDISVASADSTNIDTPDAIVITGREPIGTVEDTMSDTECEPHGLAKLSPMAAYPEYPENYGNYKVCRMLSPNVEECLILDTGENVISTKPVTPPPQSPHDSQGSSPSSGSGNHKSFRIKKSPEKSNVPMYTSMSSGTEGTVRDQAPVLAPQRNGDASQPDTSGEITDKSRPITTDYHDQYKSQITSGSRGDQRMDSGIARQYDRYGPVSHEVIGGVSGHYGERASPQFLNSEIFQDPISPRLSQNLQGRERIDHRILQSSSLYSAGSGLSSSHGDQGHMGQPSRSLNYLETSGPVTSQQRYQPQSDYQMDSSSMPVQSRAPVTMPTQDHLDNLALNVPLQSRGPVAMESRDPQILDGSGVPVQSRGPLITEEDMRRYNVNFTDPGAIQRYQQMLPRENSAETYAKLTSEPYSTPYKREEDIPIGLEDSIYNRVLRNENHSRVQSNQLPQGAIEGSYLDTRNDPGDTSSDLTEKEKALLARIYQEYGVPHLSTSLPQWSVSLTSGQTSGQSLPSNDVTMSTPSSGPIPMFKTLQEQQSSWMQMFETLEEKHEQEMKHQCRQHKDNIFDMQQKMDNELFEQQQQLRRKLQLHKEALDLSSLSRSTEPQDSRSEMTRTSERSPYQSPRQPLDHQSPARHPREHSPSWREIYQEVRRSLDDETSAPPPARRSLVEDFDTRSKLAPARRPYISPADLITPPVSRSPERPRSPRAKSPPRSRLARSKSPPMSRSSKSRSPPREISRSPPKDKSSRARSPPRERSPPRSRSPKERSPPRVRSRSPPVSRSNLDRIANEGEIPPRAGVYSSPMPLRRGKGSHSKSSSMPTTPPRNKEIYPLIVSPSMSEKRQSLVLQRELEERHHERLQQQESLDTELYASTAMSDDVHLSSSTRVGLREKHAKHMADLREYYEMELQSLRQALRASDSDMVTGHESLKHVVTDNENLHHEIRTLRENSVDIDDKLDGANRRNQELEQKVHTLEARAAEYADYYKEAQDKIASFRSTVEELEYRSRETDDTMEQLRAENNVHKNNMKKAKKVQDDQAMYIHRDRTALEKLMEQFQANEQERSILKESVNDLENKLYDARTENVEMKRTITKLELENKRLGRENDNLHHKISQGISHGISGTIYNRLHESLEVQQEALAQDHRRPSHARQQTDSGPALLSHSDSNRSPSRPLSRPLTHAAESSALNSSVQQSQRQQDSSLLNGSFHKTDDQRLLRTPPKNSQLHPKRDEDTSIADLLPASSPIMRAEEELYRLRDILRNSPTTPRELPQPKLQKKKFYGSEVVTQSRRSEMSPERHSESAKLKKKSSSNSPPSKSCKSSKSETANTKSKSSRRVLKGSGKGQSGTQDFSSQTRFDNAEDQMSRSPGDGHPQPNGLARTNRKPPVGETSGVSGEEGRRKTKAMRPPRGRSRTRCRSASPTVRRRAPSLPRVPRPCRKTVVSPGPTMTVDQMLERVRAGDYLSRPEWEDKYTSMASKPKAAPTSPRQPTSREERIKDRLRSLGDMEHRYDDLNSEKRQLESALSRLPSHGKGRKRKEELEDNLDQVEKELGSVRMSLKRYNVLKSTI